VGCQATSVRVELSTDAGVLPSHPNHAKAKQVLEPDGMGRQDSDLYNPAVGTRSPRRAMFMNAHADDELAGAALIGAIDEEARPIVERLLVAAGIDDFYRRFRRARRPGAAS
jgi:hypothetical protein